MPQLRTDGPSPSRARLPRSSPGAARWTPPPLGEFHSSFGSSVIEEFVAGHNPCDVLRELAQNEFDAGGARLFATFSAEGLNVTGNGRKVDKPGWDRLSLLLGTGRVIGDGASAREVPPKPNGIGSKNFGLRSLFLFGDRIYVRSAGLMAVLDLKELGSQRVADPTSRGHRGVTIFVPHRTESFHSLEAFTPERELTALDDIAAELLLTLVKLVLPTGRRSLRHVVVVSERSGRKLVLHQEAKTIRFYLDGVIAFRRQARLTDARLGQKRRGHTRTFDEIEFQRIVSVPTQHENTIFPSYFRASSSAIRLAVSLPIRGKRIDLSQRGLFYYPIGIKTAFTGSAVSVNAPFQMDADRTKLIDSEWNRWLASEAADLTSELLIHHWLDRFGSDAYLSVLRYTDANPPWFAEEIQSHLKTVACWPTRMRDGSATILRKAEEIIVPIDPVLDGFLEDDKYLDPRIASVEKLRNNLVEFGALRFGLNSLVRLRSAGSDEKALATKVATSEANYHFTNYQTALSEPNQQVRMAAALTKLSRQLSNQNRKDLKETRSTLAADGSLQRAADLLLVNRAIWDVCPVPLSRRLDRKLLDFKAIANLCDPFQVGDWVRQVAERARLGTILEEEHQALYQYLLDSGASLPRVALAAVRKSPVVRDHRGAWVAPIALVSERAPHFAAVEPVVSAPSPELTRAKELTRRLRIRSKLSGQDLVAYAAHVVQHVERVEGFEETLSRLSHLLVPKTIDELRTIPFIRSQTGELGAPERLHQPTAVNLACLDPKDGFVGGARTSLYRRLRCPNRPSSATMLSVLSRRRSENLPPARPEIFYGVLVSALRDERASLNAHADQPILWVGGTYRAPNETLVGSRIPRCFLSAVPQVRSPEVLRQAYEALGAHQQPTGRHWRDLFLWFGNRHATGLDVLPAEERQALREAYRRLGRNGLPEGVPETTRCLLSRDGTLHSLLELRDSSYVEDDYPELAAEVRKKQLRVAFADVNEGTSSFLMELGLRTLTSVSQTIRLAIGRERTPPPWFRPYHETRALEKLHRFGFVNALSELGRTYQRRGGTMHSPQRATLSARLARLQSISFVDEIRRLYHVASTDVQVSVEVAAGDTSLSLVTPQSLHDMEQLLAYALAELLGAASLSDLRSLALLVLPLLQCRTAAETTDFLRRQGINWRDSTAGENDHPQASFAETDNDLDDVPEQVVRELIGGLE